MSACDDSGQEEEIQRRSHRKTVAVWPGMSLPVLVTEGHPADVTSPDLRQLPTGPSGPARAHKQKALSRHCPGNASLA